MMEKPKDNMCANCAHSELYDYTSHLIYCQLDQEDYPTDHWCEKYQYFYYY
jgi:hypothetical protein